MRTHTFSRRAWLTSLPLSAAMLGTASAAPAPFDIIDCHTHFYDPTRVQGVPWPSKNSPLYRKVLPEDLRAQKMYKPVTGTVVVEASAWIEDNDWLLELAEKDPFIVGIVGRLEPGDPKLKEQVTRYAANKLYRGIRISRTALTSLAKGEHLKDLELLAEHDLSIDINGDPAATALLAAKVPSLRFIQNHNGGAVLNGKPPDATWTASLRAAAKHPNVYCKISALVESAANHLKGPAPEVLDFYRPTIDVIWHAFGDDRVIYGSNWPVSDRGASYETLQRLVMEYAAEKGDLATRKFCALNAKQAYKWVERSGRLPR